MVVPSARPSVVLLHGLFMNHFVMWPFARLLAKHGLNPILFRYPSTTTSLEENGRNFRGWLVQRETPVNIVAHSLGGLVSLEALTAPETTDGAVPPAAMVLIGSPVNGSSVGRVLASHSLLKIPLGASVSAWESNQRTAPPGWRVATIAGTNPVGAGRIFHSFSGPNDGTVTVEETILKGATSHHEVDSTHTGIIFSPKVANLVADFLLT